MNKFLNEIYILFYKWIDLGIILNIKDMRIMFEKLFKGEKSYIRHCPEEIEKDIFIIEKILANCPSKQKQLMYFFCQSCLDIYSYDVISEHKKMIQMDMVYYKAAVSQYFIVSILNGTFSPQKYNEFKKEFYQIGVVIKQFYENKEEDKKLTIANIVKSKTTELFSRYKFDYSLPPCSI